MTTATQSDSATTELVRTARSKIEDLSASLAGCLATWGKACTPGEFRDAELAIHAAFRNGADDVVACILSTVASDTARCDETRRAAYDGHRRKLRNGGRKTATITLLGGAKVTVPVDYLKVDRRRASSRRPREARGKSGTGVYPLLESLGIWRGVTPALATEVCRQITDSDSVRAGRSALARRNLDLGHGVTLRLVNHFSQRAVKQRNRWLKDARKNPPVSGPLSGKRVVVATDGGRLRQRKVKRGRRRAATSHHRYDAPWREPKLITIYTIGDDGNVDGSFRPVYDATLGDCNATFDMLAGYLRALGAHEARQLIVVADGATWIWDRTDALAAAVGLPQHAVVEVIDWFHAVEKLGEVSALATKWNDTERAAWLARAKDALHAGDTARLMTLFDEIGRGRQAAAVNKHRPYFKRNAERMEYSEFKAAHVPLGSGAVESAIRRVVNMRLKGSSKYWLEENAEGMLLFRAYLKAGRFDDLVAWSTDQHAAWWSGADTPLAPIGELVRNPDCV